MSPETTLGTPQMGAVTSQSLLLLAAITSLIVQSAGHLPTRDFHVRTYILQYWDYRLHFTILGLQVTFYNIGITSYIFQYRDYRLHLQYWDYRLHFTILGLHVTFYNIGITGYILQYWVTDPQIFSVP